MREFGSDFHFFITKKRGARVLERGQINLYADGRHAIQHLISCKRKKGEWKRIWMPEYFCYEVIKAIQETGIVVEFYLDTPLSDDVKIVQSIPFQNGDVLFRMNYFGTRSFRDNRDIPVEVIEDHSHDLISGWALNSNADWCVASLRKTLPLPEGGILWSPLTRELPEKVETSVQNEVVSYKKLSAMLLKKLYLETLHDCKDEFRKMYIEGEQELSRLQISGISNVTLTLLKQLDIETLYRIKRENWMRIKERLGEKLCYLKVNDSIDMTPFSFILSFRNKEERDSFRNKLLERDIYPAILWNIPTGHSLQVEESAEKLLSIHCDARYSLAEIDELIERINSILYS